MFSSPWIAAIFAVFAWWFSTGLILLVVRYADRRRSINHRALVVWTLPVFALGIVGLLASVATLSVANVYIAFVSVLLIWGWIEFAFLMGVITGPERRPCPDDLTGMARFMRAWNTLSYHELMLLVGLLILTVATSGSENTIAFWAYGVLFAARISAKLNLFFGVPRINTEFVPSQLDHLKSYFRQGSPTVAFAIGVTALCAATAAFATLLFSATTAPAAVGYALLTALAALAALEHWLMVIPLPDAKLWRWMLPAQPTTSNDRTIP